MLTAVSNIWYLNTNRIIMNITIETGMNIDKYCIQAFFSCSNIGVKYAIFWYDGIVISTLISVKVEPKYGILIFWYVYGVVKFLLLNVL